MSERGREGGREGVSERASVSSEKLHESPCIPPACLCSERFQQTRKGQMCFAACIFIGDRMTTQQERAGQTWDCLERFVQWSERFQQTRKGQMCFAACIFIGDRMTTQQERAGQTWDCLERQRLEF